MMEGGTLFRVEGGRSVWAGGTAAMPGRPDGGGQSGPSAGTRGTLITVLQAVSHPAYNTLL